MVALVQARDAVGAAASVVELSKLGQLHRALQSLVRTLRQHDALPVQASSVPDLRPLNPTYRMFVETVGGAYPVAINQKLQAFQGLALAHALALDSQISPTFAEGWLTLSRAGQKTGGTSGIWRRTAEAIGLTGDSLDALPTAGAPQSLDAFISTLRPLLDGSLPELRLGAQVQEDENESDVVLPSVAESPTKEAGSTGEATGEPGADGSVEEEERNHSLVRWLWVRANKAAPLDACGFAQGWDHLHRDELRSLTTSLVDDLRQGSERESRLACLMFVALLFGLPPKLALTIPLADNNDLWLSIDEGCGCWSLEQIVERDHPASAIASRGYQPKSVVRLPLALAVANFIRGLDEREDAAKLGDLLFPDEPPEILAELERYLKSKSPDTNHQPFPSRTAYSSGRLLLHLTGQDILAAVGSLDLVLAGSEQLNYVCFQEDRLFKAISDAYVYLGLGEAVAIADGGWVGSPLRPRPEVVTEGWKRIEARVAELTGLVTPRLGFDKFVAIYNELTLLYLASTIFASAHRGSELSRLTYANLYGLRWMVVVNDKASSEFASWRPLPRYPLLAQLLDGHLANLRCLAGRLDKVDRGLALRLLDICDGKRPSSAMFFTLRPSRRTYQISLIRTKDVRPIVEQYFGALNSGRHHWLSTLLERGVSRALQRVLMGHIRKAYAPHGAATGLSVRKSCEALGEAMQLTAVALKMEPLRSLGQLSRRAVELGSFVSRNTKGLNNDHVGEYLKTQDLYRYAPRERLEDPPVDRYSTSSCALISGLRESLAAGKALPDPWTCAFASFVLFNGQVFYASLRGVWSALQESKIYRLGHSTLIESHLEHSIVPVIGLPVTNLFLNKAVGAVSHPPSFQICVARFAAWLRAEVPSDRWESSDENVLYQLLAMAQRWLRCEISPHVATASDPSFRAATISTASIARIAFDRPALSSEYRRPWTRGDRQYGDHLKAIAATLHEYADTDKRIGENQRRRSLIAAALEAKHSRGVPPLVSDIVEWLRFEVTVGPKVIRLLDVGSLETYYSKLMPAFAALDLEASLQELDPDDWFFLRELVEGNYSGEQLEQRRSIFRRLARYWMQAGAAVPRGTFTDPETPSANVRVSRSSAVYITVSETEKIATHLRDALGHDELLWQKAQTKLQLLSGAPLRNGEANRIQIRDLGDPLRALHITASGFSHIKNRTSRRQVLIDGDLHGKLASLATEVSKLLGHTRFLWLWDDHLRMHNDAYAIDVALSDALSVATGEQAVRVHGFRGSHIARKIFPAVEECVREIVSGREPTPVDSVVDRDLFRVPSAALQAGHVNGLSTLLYYFSVWPIAQYAELSESLSRLPPGDHLSSYAEWEAVAQRKALSRLRSADRRYKSDWEVFLRRLSRVRALDSLEALLAKERLPEPQGTGGASGARPDFVTRELHYVALRLIGTDAGTALSESDASGSRLGRLEQFVGAAVVPDNVAATFSADRRWYRQQLAHPNRKDFLDALSRCEQASTLAVIASSMTPSVYAPVEPCAAQLRTFVSTLLDVIPAATTVSILPSRPLAKDLVLQLSGLKRQPSIKPSSKRFANGYRIGLTSVEVSSRGPRPDGDTTRFFLLVCRARLAVLLFQQTNGEANA